MANFKGAGGFGIRQSNGTLRMIRTATFSISSEVETTEASAFPYGDCGALATVDSFVSKTTWTVTVAPTSVDKGDFELLVDRLFKAAPTIVLPKPIGVFTLPATGPQTITIAGLLATDVVSVTVLDDTLGNTPLLPGTGFTVAAGAITVSGTLYQGKSVAVYRRATETAIQVIGGNTAIETLGEIEILGKVCSTRGNPVNFWAPRASRNNGVDVAIDADSFELQYKLLVPTALGWPSEFAIW